MSPGAVPRGLVHGRGVELLLDALVVVQPLDGVIEFGAFLLGERFLHLGDGVAELRAIEFIERGGDVSQNRQSIVRNLRETAEHDDLLLLAIGDDGEDARPDRRDDGSMAREHAEITLGAGNVDLIHLTGEGELFGRYELVSGFSPEITEDAVKKLGGAVDLALIDAMHTHSHSLADLRGILPFMAEGGHILLHDTFHQGIDHTVSIVLSENAHVVDCGFISRHPEITEAPVAYQGLRLLRVGTQSSDDIIRNAYLREGKPEPAFSSDLWDWDHHWNRLKTAS